MEIARVLSGYTLGGADLLRRAMGKKIKAEMDAQRERFVTGAKEHSQLSDEHANHIFDLMARFADYGFNKSHSAAYAMMAYHTAYLKANYPVEFMSALMTLDMDDTDKLSLYVQDLQRMGITLLPPDINASQPYFAVEQTPNGKAVRYALAALKGVGFQAMTDLVAERTKGGAFTDLNNFITRVNAQSFSRKQLEVLTQAGAFDVFAHPRSVLVAAADYLMRSIQRHHEESNSAQVSLFGGGATATPEALKLPDVPEWSMVERLQREFQAVGFYLSAHPVDNFRDWLQKKKYLSYTDVLNAQPQPTTARIAGVVVRKQEKKSDRGRFAFVTMSDRTGVFDVTVYSEPLLQYRDIFEAGKLLALSVDVKWNETEPRFILRTAQEIDSAVMSTVNHVEIKLLPQANGEKVAQYLGALGSGPIKLSVEVPLQQQSGMAKLVLPQGLAIQDQHLQQLRAMSGVEVVVR